VIKQKPPAGRLPEGGVISAPEAARSKRTPSRMWGHSKAGMRVQQGIRHWVLYRISPHDYFACPPAAASAAGTGLQRNIE
jgi:hypothetical protein